MTNSNQILFCFLIILIIITSLQYYRNDKYKNDEVFICGNETLIDYEYPKLNENQKLGRNFFKSLCASCHKLDKKLIGPPLSNENFTLDYFFEFTVNEKSLLNSSNIQAISVNNLYKDFLFDHNFSQLSKEDVKSIYDYVNTSF